MKALEMRKKMLFIESFYRYVVFQYLIISFLDFFFYFPPHVVYMQYWMYICNPQQ